MLCRAVFSMLVFAAGMLCGTSHGHALIIYGQIDPSNTTDPGGGAPWSYVARLDVHGSPDASGVYLGNGFILTANHVNTPTSVYLNGQSHAVDSSFAPLRVGTTDMKLIRIVEGPSVVPLDLAGSSDNELNKPATLIGWGVGKATEIQGQGWNWADRSTSIQRWGLNRTLSALHQVNDPNGLGTYASLQTRFDAPMLLSSADSQNEAAATLGDSGSGMFQQFGTANTWKLSGLTSAVTTNGQSLYDRNPSAPGNQPDTNFFVRVRDSAPLLRYQNWKEAHLGETENAEADDSDSDSVSNLLEYALGLDPTHASAAGLPHADLEEGFVTLTYTRLMSATDVNILIEETQDFVTWSPAPANEEVVSKNEMVWTIKARVPLNDAPRKFLRLIVAKAH